MLWCTISDEYKSVESQKSFWKLNEESVLQKNLSFDNVVISDQLLLVKVEEEMLFFLV